MTTTTTRIWTFATAIIVIVLVAVGWFLGAAPQLGAAARADSEREDIAAQNAVLRAATAELAADFAEIDTLREQLAEVQAEFPAYANYADFSETFLTALIRAGLTLDSAQVAAAAPISVDVVPDEFGQVPAGTLLRVPVSITVLGDLSTTLLFIDALQKSERFTFVNVASYTEGTSEIPTMVISVAYYVVSERPMVAEDGTGEGGDSEPTEPQPTPTPTVAPAPSASPTASASPTPSP